MSSSHDSHSSKPSGFAFKFTGKLKRNAVVSHLSKSEDQEKQETTDFVTCIDNNTIHSTEKTVDKSDLVIPLIKTNRYRLLDSKRRKKSNDKLMDTNVEQQNECLEDILAKRELMKEADEWSGKQSEAQTDSSLVVPLMETMLRNRVPLGFESGDKLDVSLRPDEPSADDYQTVPIEHFGLAMLRGMGWKADDPNNKSYDHFEPKIRLKGLGLGAESSVKQMANQISGSNRKKK